MEEEREKVRTTETDYDNTLSELSDTLSQMSEITADSDDDSSEDEDPEVFEMLAQELRDLRNEINKHDDELRDALTDIPISMLGISTSPFTPLPKQLPDCKPKEHSNDSQEFLDDDKLYEMAFRATFFVNPRPLGFDPNKLNFPSKLLLYLAFGKPVISTMSLGMSPEYSSVVIEIEDESEEALIRSLESAIHIDTDVYNGYYEKVVDFKESHTWEMQVSNLIKWINAS